VADKFDFSSFDKEVTADNADFSGFDDAMSEDEEKISATDALINSVFSGLTADILPKGSGVLEAAGRVIGVEGLGGTSLSDLGFEYPTLDPEKLKEAYTKIRDKRLGIQKAGEEEHPIASLVGQVGGALLTPGVAASKVAGILPKAAATIGVGAAQGGLSAFGRSEAEDIGDVASEVQSGALGGAVAGALLPAAIGTARRVGRFVKEQPAIKTLSDIAKDASKGIIYSGEDMLNKASDKMFSTAKGIIGSGREELQRIAALRENIVSRIERQGGKEQDITPILNKFDEISGVLSDDSAKELRQLENTINYAVGKGDTFKVQKMLERKAAEIQYKKTLQAKKIAEEIRALAESGDLDEEATKQLNSLTGKFNKLKSDIASIKPFETAIEETTEVPVGFVDTDYNTFIKATEGLGNFSPMKTPKQISEIIKKVNDKGLVQSMTSNEAKALRQDIRDELYNMLLSGASDISKGAYTKATAKYSNLKKAFEGAGLNMFYGVGEGGKQTVDYKKMYDAVKNFDKAGSKEGAAFRDFLKQIRELNPKLAAKIETDMTNASREFRLTAALHAPSVFSDSDLGFFKPSAVAGMSKMAEEVGTGIYKADKLATGVKNLMVAVPKKLIDSINKGDRATIVKWAEKLRQAQDKTSVELADKLDKLMTMTPNKQKAAIFALSQQPAYRSAFAMEDTED